MPIKKGSELDLIRWIRSQETSSPPSLTQGIGDDCATFDPAFAKSMALTSDLLVEDVHFRRRWVHPYFLGRKSLLVNLSDLAAMGANPYSSLLSLALPTELTDEYFQYFMAGFLEEARRWNAPLVGGDLARSSRVHVAVTVLGYVTKGSFVYRSTAQEGDLVALVGDVGLSRLGLQILRDENPEELGEIASEEDLSSWAADSFRLRCLRAHLLPQPQIEVGLWLRHNRLANAMIDVSDGLAADLLQVSRESDLKAELDAARIPLLKDMTLETALEGGEDYALLFTSSKEQVDRLARSYPKGFPPYRLIGKLKRGPSSLHLVQGEERTPYQPEGFDHFRSF